MRTGVSVPSDSRQLVTACTWSAVGDGGGAIDDRLVVAGKLRSQTKLSGWLAHASGSVLVATEMADQDEEDIQFPATHKK